MYDLDTVKNRIRCARKSVGLTQAELATKMCCNRETVTQWENGRNTPTLQSLFDLCEICQCDFGFLVGEYEQKRRETSDICMVTGLSADAANVLIGDRNDGFSDDRLEALNFLLTSSNFENALHELARFKDAEREAASLERAKERAISKLKDISEYHPNVSLLELISNKRQEATLCEYNLSKSFTFIIDEIKRTVDENVFKVD